MTKLSKPQETAVKIINEVLRSLLVRQVNLNERWGEEVKPAHEVVISSADSLMYKVQPRTLKALINKGVVAEVESVTHKSEEVVTSFGGGWHVRTTYDREVRFTLNKEFIWS